MLIVKVAWTISIIFIKASNKHIVYVNVQWKKKDLRI